VVCTYEVYFGNGGAARKAVGLGTSRTSASVGCSVVDTGSPTALLRHEMEGGRSWSLGVPGCTIPQHDVKLSLGHGQAVWDKAARTTGYRLAECVVLYCDVIRDGSQLVSAPGIPPAGCVEACLL
jgi:hypothetical protein